MVDAQSFASRLGKLALILGFLVGCGGQTDRAGADSDGGTHSDTDAGRAGDAGPPKFPVGVYSCQSSVFSMNASFSGVAGGNGSLALTQTGATVTAVYTGDTNASGSIAFTVTTGSSANPVSAGQTFESACGLQAETLTPLAVASGSLVSDANTIVLTLVGAQGVADGGTYCDVQVTLTLVCELG